ncbi:MAG: DivIVA domain-containing protein [Oscillospiraceae bacterium]|nr:DivIVA domain-containing protein [Oscillospiraceae bacterium]MBQ4315835.1 DivIVA domain-containing protein [Oscillospiraceae bacterium]
MFTPNELKEIKFDKAVFGGYDTEDVDKAFSAISEDYTTLFKENTVLKKKLKLLADTVEDYRSVDEAMRKALITAQNMANDMIADAEKKSREMLANASDDAKARIRELTSLVEAEEKKLLEARNKTAQFIDNITAMFAAENEKFISLKNAVAPETPPATEPDVMPSRIGDTLDEIALALDEKIKLEEEQIREEPAKAEPLQEPEEDEDADMKKVSDTISFESDIPTEEEMAALEAAAEKPHRRHRVEFENLKFGTSYDMKSED